MKKSAVIIFVMLISVMFSACSNKNSETLTKETATQEMSETVIENEESKVLEVYENVQQAMIDKDMRYYHRTDAQLIQFAGWRPQFETK